MGVVTQKTENSINLPDSLPLYLENYGVTGLLEHLIAIAGANAKSKIPEVAEEWGKCKAIIQRAVDQVDKEISPSF